jgi:hypothetical protein
LRLVILLHRFSTLDSCRASVLAIAQSITQRQIRHLDDKPSQACRHPNLIGADATDSQQSTRERRVLLCLASSPATVRLSLFDSFVFGLP